MLKLDLQKTQNFTAAFTVKLIYDAFLNLAPNF